MRLNCCRSEQAGYKYCSRVAHFLVRLTRALCRAETRQLSLYERLTYFVMLKTTDNLGTQPVAPSTSGNVYKAEDDLLVEADGQQAAVAEGDWFICNELDQVNGGSSYWAWDERLLSGGIELLPMDEIRAALPSVDVEAMPTGPQFVVTVDGRQRPFNRSADGIRKAAAWLAMRRLDDYGGGRRR